MISSLGIGGAERHLVNLTNAQTCEFRAVIFTGSKPIGPSFHGDLDSEIQQHFVPIRRRSLPLGVLRLASLLRKLGVNVVHTHMFESNLYGCLAATIARVPVVVTSEHGENPWKNGFHRWLERKVISPRVDARFCVSPQILALRRDLDGVPASKLRLTVNGTPLPTYLSGESPGSVPMIGAVGRLIPVKDHRRLLMAAQELQRRGHDFRLSIVGDGPEAGSLREMVTECRLEDIVQLPGMVTDVGSWYRRFDIYVSSSIREGQPMALLEAMAYGLPVVSTDVGAAAATVGDRVAGLIVPPADTTALANALGQLLEDESLRRTFGRNARLRVEKEFSVGKVAETLTAFYGEALSRKQAARRLVLR